MKLLLLFIFTLVNSIAKGQVLRYDICYYENCIYDKQQKIYEDCKSSAVDDYAWIEVDKNKKLIRFKANDVVKTYQIKKATVFSSSTEYFVSDESGMIWLYQIQYVEDEDHFELHIWQCNKKRELVYILGKASVGIWGIEAA